MTGRQEKQLDYLLADFNAIKAEIMRRSNLQRVVLAAYVTVVAFAVRYFTENKMSVMFLVGLWLSSALAFQFYIREGLEINRLGSIIKDRIAPIAGTILEVNSDALFPSETNARFPSIDKITSNYDNQFNWILFFIIPFAVTLLYLSQDWSRLAKLICFKTRSPYIGLVVFLSSARILYLLKKYAWWKKNDA
jgi:hypothetical protein